MVGVGSALVGLSLVREMVVPQSPYTGAVAAGAVAVMVLVFSPILLPLSLLLLPLAAMAYYALSAQQGTASSKPNAKQTSTAAAVAPSTPNPTQPATPKPSPSPPPSAAVRKAPTVASGASSGLHDTLYVLAGGEAAKQVGDDLAKAVRRHGYDAKYMPMETYQELDIEQVERKLHTDGRLNSLVCVFVVETVENAQPAEAAGACVRAFNRRRKAGKEGLLKGKLHYSVLALGDSNLLLDRQTTTAKDCNQAGQTLDSSLNYLGANCFLPRGEADDRTGEATQACDNKERKHHL